MSTTELERAGRESAARDLEAEADEYEREFPAGQGRHAAAVLRLAAEIARSGRGA